MMPQLMIVFRANSRISISTFTGTFICSDICMYLLDNTGQINIRQVVKLIRTQRAFAVQMPDQYVFCHLAILQYAQQQGILPPDIDIPSLLEDDDL